MSFVRYKIGDTQKVVQFDQTVDKELFVSNLVDRLCLTLEEGQIQNPVVKVSLFPPKDIQNWQKFKYNISNKFIIYIKNDTNFHIQYFAFQKQIVAIIINLVMFSFIMSKNIIRLHSMLLNNGDIIFGGSGAGKSTLARRINTNNQNLKCICDDGVLIDLDNKKVYPLPYFFEEVYGIFNYTTCGFKSYNIKRIMLLQKNDMFDKNQRLDYEINEESFLRNLFDCAITFLYFPFSQKEGIRDVAEEDKWINIKKGLEDKIRARIRYIIENNKEKFIPICIHTSERRYDLKFNVIPDII